jgi:hypothetical protein
MSKSIFNIKQEYVELLNQLEEVEGELTPELEAALVISREELETKAAGYAYVVNKLQADEDVIASEIERLKALKASKAKNIERLKTSVRDAMVLFDVVKIETPLMVLSLRKSEETIITDETIVAGEYMREKITLTPDKTAIKKAIKEGKKVEGAEVIEKQNLQIK